MQLFRPSRPSQNLTMIGVGLAVAIGGRYVLKAAEAGVKAYKEAKANEGKASSTPKPSYFGKNFYQGGFDPVLNRREAALILGVRETASQQRINHRYRELMRLNHPDLVR